MVIIHYFGSKEVDLLVNVDYWVVLDDGSRRTVSKEMRKRLLLDEDYSHRLISPKMQLLAREDFLQIGQEELCKRPRIVDVYNVILKEYVLQRLPP